MTEAGHIESLLPRDARIFVTGSSGFIGTNLVDFYRSRGYAVGSIDSVAPRNSAQKGNWQACDVLDLSKLKALVGDFQPTHVFHLGARTDLLSDSLSDYRANTDGVENMIRALGALPGQHSCLYASSRLVNEIGYVPKSVDDYNPTTAYGASKVEGERIVKAVAPSLKRPWMIVRPTSIWGPWFEIPYRQFFDYVLSGRYIHPSRAAIYKSFGYVGNCVYELDRLMARCEENSGSTCYLADYEPIEVGAFADAIRARALKSPVRRVSPALLELAAKIGDSAKSVGVKHPPLTTFRLRNLTTQMIYDLAPTQAIVGPLPFSTDEGVRATVDWMLAQQKVVPH